MNKTIALLKRGFALSASNSPDFIAFCRTYKSEFRKVLNQLGCTGLECRNGHFYISGYFNSADGRLWYFSLDDVRCIGRLQLLVRTAQHRKDYKGGTNRYADLKTLTEDLGRIIL